MEQEKGEAQRDFEAILSEVEDWRMSRIKGQQGTQGMGCWLTLVLYSNRISNNRCICYAAPQTAPHPADPVAAAPPPAPRYVRPKHVASGYIMPGY
jgi:hypothetical protein